jgi:YrhK-like protein
MTFFHPSNRTDSPKHERIYAVFEIWYTVVDLTAALLFVIGSILFFLPETRIPATWMFVIGSVCFALKPTIRLMREIKFLRMGKIERLAEREYKI